MKRFDFDHGIAYAYALGYFDGRSKGVDCNHFMCPYEHYAYGQGYERGVSDYCELDEVATQPTPSVFTEGAPGSTQQPTKET